MLTQIYVKNFILIDEVQLSLYPHMSAFTGETGAGKSLLMDAIGILKGDRISSDLIKQGCDKAIIEGVFEISSNSLAYKLLTEAGYEVEDGVLIITREFTKEGKSIVRINHRTTTVSFLKQITSYLVDIHSQHETHYLRHANSHLMLLDRFAQSDELLKEVKENYQIYDKLKKDYETALHQDYNEDDLEFLTFQLNEIDEASLIDGELEELEQEQKQMMSYEKNTETALSAVQLLDNNSITSIYEAYRLLNTIQDDEIFQTLSSQLLDAYYQIDDYFSQIKKHVEEMEFDEERFHEIQERIFLLHKIYRKYGNTYDLVMEKRAFLEEKIDSILHRQDYINKQEKKVKDAYQKYQKVSETLHALRVKKAKELEELILIQLKDLQLPNARFHVEINKFDGNASGIDQVSFLISMNAGESLRPLHTAASGGELSRFMLGLKTVFTSLSGIDTVIFDEIDTGVSGSVAFSIGKKMAQLGQKTQVFCVTHLANVAACAKYHYIVEKHQGNNQTKTSIRLLNEEERIQELAFISTGTASKTALEAATEFYKKAKEETGNN